LDYGSDHPSAGGTGHQHHRGAIIDPSTTLVDPLVVTGACAAVTSRIRLATGIFILPLRHPLLTARMALTPQDVAGGRFMLGVGSGWRREEFDALGVPFDDRAGPILPWCGSTRSRASSTWSSGPIRCGRRRAISTTSGGP
jgi:alkanesulfonate monooxygenase SsuD/methylene tetrahydromethanopterin reductase-like flavin-dependent oxidoreductase (luciferase family)